MEEKVQQRVCINFCFRLGKTGAETYEMLQAAFGESCLSRSKTFETVSRVREIIHADRRLTIREVAEDVGIAFSPC
jgi:hypothetical protein